MTEPSSDRRRYVGISRRPRIRLSRPCGPGCGFNRPKRVASKPGRTLSARPIHGTFNRPQRGARKAGDERRSYQGFVRHAREQQVFELLKMVENVPIQTLTPHPRGQRNSVRSVAWSAHAAKSDLSLRRSQAPFISCSCVHSSAEIISNRASDSNARNASQQMAGA